MLCVTQGLFLRRGIATARIKQCSSKKQHLNHQVFGSLTICGASRILVLICSSPVRCSKKEKKKKLTKNPSSYPRLRCTEGMIFTLVQIKQRLSSTCLSWSLCCPCPRVAEVVSTGFPALMAGLIHYLVAISQLQPDISQPSWLCCKAGSQGGRAKTSGV